MIQISKIRKKNKDISAERLEKLVKASGDDCVAGYVRFRKIKACAGYKRACNKAAMHLSVVKGGRPMGNNLYAAVVRFRLIVFLIPLFLMLLAGIFLTTKQKGVKAIELVTEEHQGVIEPEETIKESQWNQSPYAGLYICVPGYSDCIWDKDQHGLPVYNSEKNNCLITYQVYVGGEQVAQSEPLSLGEEAVLDFYDRLTTGVYTMEIVARAYSPDMTEEFNSVYQEVQLTVY